MAISAPHPDVHASFARLHSGPGKGENGAGHFTIMPTVLDDRVAVTPKTTVVGSYADLPLPDPVGSGAVAIHCWVFPTRTDGPSPQAVWSLVGLRLLLLDNTFQIEQAGEILLTLPLRVESGHWYSVLVSLTADAVKVDVGRLDAKVRGRATSRAECNVDISDVGSFLLATSGVGNDGMPGYCFNGKIDSPSIYRGDLDSGDRHRLRKGLSPLAEAWASWEFGNDIGADYIRLKGHETPRGAIMNGAERGVTGRNWNGYSDSFNEFPEQYCAIQFHDDDMVDAGWAYELEFALPSDLPSGVYLVRLVGGTSVNYFPLFVRAALPSVAKVLFLIPTNTYLAYANDHLAVLDFSAVMGHEKIVPPEEQYLQDHPEPGRSCYDRHADGTPVRYSSGRRPLFNVRPNAVNWLTGSYRHFPVDMFILEWLEHTGVAFDVATDEDLEKSGKNLLDNYNVVVTGSHPEYWTREGLEFLDEYMTSGGRLMYLGGNGFYWVTTKFSQRPWVIEVRRDNVGTRCWDAPYGERTHAASGEAGGIWRTRGKSPNKLVGLGFASEGFSRGCGYRRLASSYESPAKIFFEGIAGDVIGQQGFVLDGAVADEIDRFDVSLGSPEHALVLATSTGLGNEYQVVIEDMTLMLPDLGGAQRPDLVRADMIVFSLDGGGAVFSAGSIAYGGALAWNGCHNDLSSLSTNVLKAFSDRSFVIDTTTPAAGTA
ncbi:N,N-dimethylformamidase [Methylorubrum populi]|uniref:N,N-dimethylformamidase beta subunit family domain-containing protein n=1 Tax=Methylorubrum populi TaxID=223967 RepID=UPI001154E707|nr:N,N-dimethylformamidase beta subunit family domain-containing protein [Methylorubrum populi]QDI79919.1 N,N-dimethylformamidase [Methylorubrum populi]